MNNGLKIHDIFITSHRTEKILTQLHHLVILQVMYVFEIIKINLC